MAETQDPTQLLVDSRQGKKEALDALLPQVRDTLRQIAHRLLQRRPANRVLDTTGLVHEAYLKLIDQSRVEWVDRSHFQALAARVMRQILIDHFRKQQAEKRGGSNETVTLEEETVPTGQRGALLLALDEALDRLREQAPRKAQVVMYRFFGGMSQRAIAETLNVSARTVRRDWRAAKAWLTQELTDAPSEANHD